MVTITATYAHYFVSVSGYIWQIKSVFILLKFDFQSSIIPYYFIRYVFMYHFTFIYFFFFFPRVTKECKCIPAGCKFCYYVYILIIKPHRKITNQLNFFNLVHTLLFLVKKANSNYDKVFLYSSASYEILFFLVRFRTLSNI